MRETISRLAILLALVPTAAGSAQDGDTQDAGVTARLTNATESDLPPLPQTVVLPKPADHRIADDPKLVPMSAGHFARARAAIGRGIEALLARQHRSGGWMVEAEASPTGQDAPSPVSTAVTAMVLKAIVQAEPQRREGTAFRAGLAYIRSTQAGDGSFRGGALSNYVTSTVVQALAGIDDDTVHDEMKNAVGWLQSAQWDGTEGVGQRQDWYGGAGYGSHGRPDLSNTQVMLDALYDTGMSPDEPAFQRALAFVSRAQNLQATNKSAWAGNDGGFIYTPANGGESMGSQAAGEGRYGELLPEGAARSLRSYGSMTYAGFKSMLYAGLSAQDIRVRAAFDWIRRNFTFDENPGLGQQGLYYYYHTMGRALTVAQQSTITDIHGRTHNWRESLIDALLARQREDGLWANPAERWLEGEPEMATVHAVLALEEALKPVGP